MAKFTAIPASIGLIFNFERRAAVFVLKAAPIAAPQSSGPASGPAAAPTPNKEEEEKKEEKKEEEALEGLSALFG